MLGMNQYFVNICFFLGLSENEVSKKHITVHHASSYSPIELSYFGGVYPIFKQAHVSETS